jgi:hypothetical protein
MHYLMCHCAMTRVKKEYVLYQRETVEFFSRRFIFELYLRPREITTSLVLFKSMFGTGASGKNVFWTVFPFATQPFVHRK